MFDMFIEQGRWKDIAEFLEKSGLSWVFIGAQDVALAKQSMPHEYHYLLVEKIKVLGFSELNSLFSHAFAYLAVPGVFGGGLTASLAISHDVSVLTAIDSRSDLSNALPHDVQYESLAEILSVIHSWEASPAKRKKLLVRQQAVHKKRKKLFKKAEELKSILDEIYLKYGNQRESDIH